MTLSDALQISDAREVEILALNEALERLERQSARLAKIVELRVFAGMTVEEVATELGVSGRTVDRDWKIARARLTRDLSN
jgi:RNA polymerase sigma factor (sigma-70 family)